MSDTGVLDNIVIMCVTFHEKVKEMAEKSKKELNRHIYVTPTSYLQLIQTYTDLLISKRDKTQSIKTR